MSSYEALRKEMRLTRKWTPDPAVYSAEARAELEAALRAVVDTAEKLKWHAQAASEDGACIDGQTAWALHYEVGWSMAMAADRLEGFVRELKEATEAMYLNGVMRDRAAAA
jgi:hypothetical protein